MPPRAPVASAAPSLGARSSAAPPTAARASAPSTPSAPSFASVVPHPTIALLRTRSLASAAQQEIERMILGGELAPGTKLTEAWLSEKLGVSRGPIREAFRMLEEAGLVRQEKNRGAFVRDIPVDEAVEIFDLRAVMDELIGRRLAAALAPDQSRRLKALVEQMEQAARANDADAYHLLNLQFHDHLVEFAGNRKMAAIYRKLVKELALFRRRNLTEDQVLTHSAAEHRQILRAIQSGDAEAAGRAMYEHVMESKARMLRAESERARPTRARAGAGTGARRGSG